LENSKAKHSCTEKPLRQATDDFQAAANLTGEIIVQVDREGRWTFLNDRACEFWGKPREDLLGIEFADYLHPDDHPKTIAVVEAVATGKTVRGVVNRQKTPKGWRTVEWNAAPIFNGHGEHIGLQATGRDITERRQMEAALLESEARFRSVFESSLVPINVVDAAGKLIRTNEAFQKLVGYAAEELGNMSFRDISHQDGIDHDAQLFTELVEGKRTTYQIQKQYVHKTGKHILVDMSVCGVFSPDGEFQYSFATFRDITKEKEYEERLVWMARHDPTTSVYNRHALKELLANEVTRARRYNHPIGMMMVDVNRFKEVNDRFGHAMGDKVLQAIAGILEHNVRESDIVVRYGGDEFLVVLLETSGETNLIRERILEEVAQWNETNPLLQFPVTLAIGSVHWNPKTGQTIEQALVEADRSMYEDKRNPLDTNQVGQASA